MLYWACKLLSQQLCVLWSVFTGQGPSIANNYYIPGTIKEGDSGDITDDNYNYLKEDVRRIKTLRVKIFFFFDDIAITLYFYFRVRPQTWNKIISAYYYFYFEMDNMRWII